MFLWFEASKQTDVDCPIPAVSLAAQALAYRELAADCSIGNG